ncbi:hypothetical protein GCM10023190_19570 [Enteractinococcus fodinae]|uniref:Membrane protein n=1 Tax=Enteractinococcus fodinae TaxID=684663 RepID=A0ABU2B3V2_9MICC|nr:hypothetical protein [Enteractinococcus fodinae]MDR7348282.1 putative membrane protein [Enteractinococcus fodinae]
MHHRFADRRNLLLALLVVAVFFALAVVGPVFFSKPPQLGAQLIVSVVAFLTFGVLAGFHVAPNSKYSGWIILAVFVLGYGVLFVLRDGDFRPDQHWFIMSPLGYIAGALALGNPDGLKRQSREVTTRNDEAATAHMNDQFEAAPLYLGEVCFRQSVRTRNRLFGQKPKIIPMVNASTAGHEMEFDFLDIYELTAGPILIDAISATPPGDYFLASPTLIPPSSAVGTSLQNVRFNDNSLLLLHGSNILAEFSPAQQADLLAWLRDIGRN